MSLLFELPRGSHSLNLSRAWTCGRRIDGFGVRSLGYGLGLPVIGRGGGKGLSKRGFAALWLLVDGVAWDSWFERERLVAARDVRLISRLSASLDGVAETCSGNGTEVVVFNPLCDVGMDGMLREEIGSGGEKAS